MVFYYLTQRNSLLSTKQIIVTKQIKGCARNIFENYEQVNGMKIFWWYIFKQNNVYNIKNKIM